MDALIVSLKRHEGYRDEVYLDSEGHPTCGWGHCLRVGSRVPLEASEAFFRSDVARAVSDFYRIPKTLTDRLNESRKRVICEMIFNLGLSGVLNFKRMWAAIEREDFNLAAEEMLDSKWASQVGKRSVELANIMKDISSKI